MMVHVFDRRSRRLAAVSEMLSGRLRIAGVKSEAEVPTERQIAEFVAGLRARWLILLHVGNDRSLMLIRAVTPSLGPGRCLVLYSGGDKSNFDAIERHLGSSFCTSAAVKCVPYVSREWLEPLRAAIGSLAASYESADQSAVSLPKHEERSEFDADLSCGALDRMRAFEEFRAHVSHDLFSNEFCVALGFHCTEVGSPRRRDLLVWARSDPRWWKNLRGPASRWLETRRSIEEVLDRAEAISGRMPMPAFRETVDEARAAMATIDPLMEKFAGSVFEAAGLTDEEIERFWTSTDTIRQALQAVRVADRGFDPAFFGEAYLRHESAD
jgi:hypothetical protein